MAELTAINKLYRLHVAELIDDTRHIELYSQYNKGGNADQRFVNAIIVAHVNHCIDAATDLLNDGEISMARCRAMREAARNYEFSEFVQMRNAIKR